MKFLIRKEDLKNQMHIRTDLRQEGQNENNPYSPYGWLCRFQGKVTKAKFIKSHKSEEFVESHDRQ